MWWLAAAVCACLVLPGLAQARGSGGLKTVRYRGYSLMIPSAWPVFHLASDPRVCVRFDRHAVYLGNPGSRERCAGQMAGRTEAILIAPVARGGAQALPPASLAAAQGSSAQILNRAHDLLLTATWYRHPGVIARALRIASPAAAAAASVRRPARSAVSSARFHSTRASGVSGSTPGQIYTGQAFDACSTPSSSQLSAWGSAFRGVGVYIGGANMACAQTNLTASWVSQESAAGWHLIPIYVGLQAPNNYCGCAAMSAARAASDGQTAAQDAVARAQSLGLGTGNPIYYDMEGYGSGASTSSAVLTFLGAWTQQLHRAGYLSGVYSSDDSGISDLVSRYGTGYPEPDEIWPANWNGQSSTADPRIPSGDWAGHQRVHQYAGNETQTHGGVTINIDSDYVDGATAAAGSASLPPPSGAGGNPIPTFWLYTAYGNVYPGPGSVWFGSPAASGANPGFLAGMAPTRDDRGYWMVSSTGQVFNYGDAPAAAVSPALSLTHPIIGIVAPASGGYWLYTGYGNVYTGSGTPWYGSPAASQAGASLITGMASTPDGKGYWLVDSSGRVFHYGDAAALSVRPAPSSAHPILGLVASSAGGYWLYNQSGNVYTSTGAVWYGSPYASGARESSIVGMTATSDGKGYWLVDSSGRVFSYGDATPPASASQLPSTHAPITGLAG